MKDKFIKAYTENITRPGADKLLAWIESSDFFTAPASTRFHLSSPGGLLEHSLHVFERMKAICANEATITPGFNEPSMETIAVCGLLHDICKANFYAVEMRNRKNDQGRWEQYPFYVVDDKLPYPYGPSSACSTTSTPESRFSPRTIGTTTTFTRTCTMPPTRSFLSMSERDWKACTRTSRTPFRIRSLMQCGTCKD